MLPDMIVGLFTGKTKSLNLSNSLLPVASILAGMFVRNPLLKTLLIGLGGMNLVNKVGHEALQNKQNEGWDNPNVFQICTLKSSASEVRKRQEVGRGLRLCVNQNGERMDESPNL